MEGGWVSSLVFGFLLKFHTFVLWLIRKLNHIWNVSGIRCRDSGKRLYNKTSFHCSYRLKEMTGFIHLSIQKGEETALIEYDNRGISLSVYGVSLLNKDFDIPRWEMINMDNWELILGNWYKIPVAAQLRGWCRFKTHIVRCGLSLISCLNHLGHDLISSFRLR